MNTRVALTLALWMGLLASSPAGAAITAFWQQVTITPEAITNDPALASMQSWDLMATTTGDWNGAGMLARVPDGLTFYRHALGGFTKPDPALFGSSPALEFTTHVSSPSDNGSNQTTVVLGSHGGAPNASLGDLDGIFNVAWGDLVSDPPGTYQIARLTFPASVLPDVHNPPAVGGWSVTSQINPDSTTIIPDIPEFGSIGWLVGAGLMLWTGLSRRRLAEHRWANVHHPRGESLIGFWRCGAMAEPLESRRMLSFSVAFPVVPTLTQDSDVNTTPFELGNPNYPGNPGHEGESLVVINPTNPNNIVAFAVDFDGTGALDTDKSWTSFDGGLTYAQSAIALPAGHTGGGDPAAAFDRAGNLYYVHLTITTPPQADAVSIAKSTNGGQTWSVATVAATDVAPDKCWITTGPRPGFFNDPTKDIVYVVYNDSDRVPHCVRSLDNGASFQNDVIFAGGAFMNIVASQRSEDNGRLFAVYEKEVLGPPTSTEIRLNYSNDGGLTWQQNGQVVATSPIFRTEWQGPGFLPSPHGTHPVPSVTVANAGTYAGRVYVSYTSFLSLPDRFLDLGDNRIIVDYSGASPAATVRALLTSGYGNGAWTGSGIRSSAAAADDDTGIGYAEAADLFSTFPATFSGHAVDDTAVLLRHTGYGDTDLNGNVNLADFDRLADNFGTTSGASWFQGDFDFNGNVNLADFDRLANNFGMTFSDDAEDPGDGFVQYTYEDLLEMLLGG